MMIFIWKRMMAILFMLNFFGFVTPIQAEVIAIQGGKIYPVSRDPIESGTVLIEDGLIKAVDAVVNIPADARIIQAQGQSVYPGLIDAFNHIGLIEISAVPSTVDSDEGTDPLTPQMEVIYAINPLSALFPVGRTTGVTTALCAPESGNVMTGQSALIHLSGNQVSEMVIKHPAALHITLGEAAKGKYPDKFPTTRMGIAALLRQTLTKAQEYEQKWMRYQEKLTQWQKEQTPKDPAKTDETASQPEKKEQPTAPDRDLLLESLLPLLRGELPAIITANRLDDIETAIRMSQDFHFKLILDSATDAYKIADAIASLRIPVIVHPILTQPSSMETSGAIYESASLLAKAGVKIALQTRNPHNIRDLPFEVGRTVAYGLPWDEALRAVTIHPAQMFGVDDRIGSLDPGKIADIVVADGDIFQPLTRIKHVFIQGKEISFENHDTRRYEMYRKP